MNEVFITHYRSNRTAVSVWAWCECVYCSQWTGTCRVPLWPFSAHTCNGARPQQSMVLISDPSKSRSCAIRCWSAATLTWKALCEEEAWDHVSNGICWACACHGWLSRSGLYLVVVFFHVQHAEASHSPGEDIRQRSPALSHRDVQEPVISPQSANDSKEATV